MTRQIPISSVRSRRVIAALGLGAAGLLLPLCLGGCLGQNNIEPVQGGFGSFENPNSPPVPQAMATALQWVALRYPPGMSRLDMDKDRPQLSVNFPVGVRRDVAEYVCRNVGPYAQPLTEEGEPLPVYHIARVWTRGLYATVDIFRPATQLGDAPQGQTLYQCITVKLRSGIGSYSVYAHQVWPVGSFETPGLHYLAPGHGGRTQPAPGEGPLKLPALMDERRSPPTQPVEPADPAIEMPDAPAGQPVEGSSDPATPQSVKVRPKPQ